MCSNPAHGDVYSIHFYVISLSVNCGRSVVFTGARWLEMFATQTVIEGEIDQNIDAGELKLMYLKLYHFLLITFFKIFMKFNWYDCRVWHFLVVMCTT